MPATPDLGFDSAAVLAVVREAAALAMQWRGRAAVDVKADSTLVTAADRAVEQLLQERLYAIAPHVAFLGEETGFSGAVDAPCWAIDPIDGTTNFVRGIPLWCVSVGLVQGGDTLLGVLAVPPQNELMHAVQGGGAWIEPCVDSTSRPERIRCRDSMAPMQEDLIACNTTAEEAVNFGGVPCRLRNLGSLAYHLGALARGSLLACVAQQHKLYDVAAGLCISREAGCRESYLDGGAWQAHITTASETRALLAAPPQALELLMRKLQRD